VIYSIGCFKGVDRTALEPYWDDCLEPQSDWLAERQLLQGGPQGLPLGRSIRRIRPSLSPK
jgi:hypothetical protein